MFRRRPDRHGKQLRKVDVTDVPRIIFLHHHSSMSYIHLRLISSLEASHSLFEIYDQIDVISYHKTTAQWIIMDYHPLILSVTNQIVENPSHHCSGRSNAYTTAVSICKNELTLQYGWKKIV